MKIMLPDIEFDFIKKNSTFNKKFLYGVFYNKK